MVRVSEIREATKGAPTRLQGVAGARHPACVPQVRSSRERRCSAGSPAQVLETLGAVETPTLGIRTRRRIDGRQRGGRRSADQDAAARHRPDELHRCGVVGTSHSGLRGEQVRRRDSGVREVAADAPGRGIRSPLQLHREQAERDLGRAVRLHGVVVVLPGEVIPLDRALIRRDAHLARHVRSPGPQQRQRWATSAKWPR